MWFHYFQNTSRIQSRSYLGNEKAKKIQADTPYLLRADVQMSQKQFCKINLQNVDYI